MVGINTNCYDAVSPIVRLMISHKSFYDLKTATKLQKQLLTQYDINQWYITVKPDRAILKYNSNIFKFVDIGRFEMFIYGWECS
jgi:hypothetical protein